MEREFRLMIIWGDQYIFLITVVCACARVWYEERDIKAAWLLAELE